MSVVVVRATRALRIERICYEGCPMIVRDGGLDPVPSLWLTVLWTTRSHDTAISYARSLRKFLAYLEDRGLSWWEANADDIELLQARMQLAGRPAATINPTITAIAMFYQWAAKRGFIVVAPFVVRSRASSAPDVLASPIRPMRAIQKRPRYLTKDEYDRVLAHIPAGSPEVLRRTELIFHCGRYMGLRRKEVAGLSVLTFIDLSSEAPGSVDLDPATTKGYKARTVPIPGWLAHEIKVYVEAYRDDTVARLRSTRRSYRAPSNLFLTQDGRPITREYITKIWAVATDAAGIPSRFHMNRHWFGTVMVASLTVADHPNPLQRVADMMGHADTRTTALYNHPPTFADGDAEEIRLIERGWGHDASAR